MASMVEPPVLYPPDIRAYQILWKYLKGIKVIERISFCLPRDGQTPVDARLIALSVRGIKISKKEKKTACKWLTIFLPN